MNLLNQINQTRNHMYKMGQALGLSHPDTVKVSQELDDLIIQAQLRGIKA